MSESKTQKLPLYKDASLLVSKGPTDEENTEVLYTVVERESTALDEVFNTLFEKVIKQK